MTMLEAALKRAAGIAARGDRPTQRRNADGGRASLRVRVAGLQLRDNAEPGGLLQFSGMASVCESPYEMYDFFGPYNEVVSDGAFLQTLAVPGLDVPLVLQHDLLRRIARTTNGTLQLAEIDGGLQVRAQLDPADPDVAYIAPKLRAGLIDEMSFAFLINSGQWSPDYSEFRINSVDINRGDVAIVGYGANPATSASVRSKKQRAGVGFGPDDSSDPAHLCAAVDAVIDQAVAMFATVPDQTSLPAEVQQGIALVTSAHASVDALMAALNVPDPDDDAQQLTAKSLHHRQLNRVRLALTS